jgi:hypothetical protein
MKPLTKKYTTARRRNHFEVLLSLGGEGRAI